MVGLFAFGLTLLLIATSLQACAVVLAGKALRIQQLNIKQAIWIAFLWTGLNAAATLINTQGSLWLTLAVSGVVMAASIVIPRIVLGLRIRRTLAFNVTASLIVLALSLVLFVPLRLIAWSPYRCTSDSMAPTLQKGDQFIVNKLAYRLHSPQRWDVAAFRHPLDAKHLHLYRVIGLPGETFEIREGQVIINGQLLEQPRRQRPLDWPNQGEYGQQERTIKIPAKSYIVLGDNSGVSYDSRFWGYVPEESFVGRAFFIFFPLNRFAAIE